MRLLKAMSKRTYFCFSSYYLPRKRKKGSIRRPRNNFCHNNNWITRICSMGIPHIHWWSRT